MRATKGIPRVMTAAIAAFARMVGENLQKCVST